MSQNKLDIWELLRNIDDKNNKFIVELPEDEKKGFAPIVALRWLSGGGNQVQLLNLNELVNSTVFNLYKHPNLLYSLMVASTPKHRKNYNWVKGHKKKKMTKRIDVIRRYLDVSPYEAESFLPLYSNEDVLDMAQALGEPAESIKLLKSEMK